MDAGDPGDQLIKAVSAHAAWKVKLASAIESGSSGLSVEIVRRNDQCDLGRWLASVGPELRRGGQHASVTELHARFHLAAAGVLALAVRGEKAGARDAMALGSEFSRASNQLTLALTAWREAIA